MLELNLLLAALFLLLVIWNGRYGSLLVSVLSRWLRLAVLTIATTSLCVVFEWLDRPLPILLAASAICWILIDSLRNWIVTGVLSRSQMPLFPRFRRSEEGDAWPVSASLLKLKAWIRKAGFRFEAAVHADLTDDVRIHGSLFSDPSRTTRLQVLFLPQRNGSFIASLAFQSVHADGTCLLTDNSFVPFGGFFPENYDVRREPLLRSPDRLLKLHADRIEKLGGALRIFETDAVSDLNDLQSQMEQVNVDLGFMTPRPSRSEDGLLTHEGRYRLWREMGLLEYFGVASRYRD